MKHRLTAVTAVLLLAAASGCSSDEPDDEDTTTLTVYAASSLTASFEQIGEEFEADHDGVEVEFNFAGSSDLVAQIEQGAPADVFASADEANMDKLDAAGDMLGTDPQLFAWNMLEIAVPPGNPAGVETFKDLGKPDLNLVICAPEVPCGAAAQRVSESTGVELEPVSEEQSVTDVLAKVTSGEADAGLVYVTDVIAAGDEVEGIEFSKAESAINFYPIASVANSENADLAGEFIELVLGDTGQAILEEAGFGRP